MKRYKHLNKSGKWPSGNPRLYYRKKGAQAVALPDYPKGSSVFDSAYEKAALPEPGLKLMNHPAMKALTPGLNRAKQRARKKNLPCEISISDLARLFTEQKGRCALTGIRFDIDRPETGCRKPFSPSIDRIIPTQGYVIGNIRLACVIANLARGDFSDTDFQTMCTAVARYMNKKVPTFPEVPTQSKKSL